MNKVRIPIPYKILAVFGPNPVSDNGKDELIYYCPQCEARKGTPDRKGKLYVNTKSYKFNCFRCGYKGQIGHIRVDSRKVYEETIDQDVENLVKNINEINNQSKFDLKIPIEKVTSSETATHYLLSRGFTYEQMAYYDLRVGNLNYEFGRIVIPNQVEHLVYTDYYSARTYIDQKPKYHNPGKNKSTVVFNLHRIEEGTPIVIVEGALTAIAAGYHAVATLGKTITIEQASQIIKKKPSRIYVNYDYGAEEYSHKACQILRSISSTVPIYEVFMDTDRDAADMSPNEYFKYIQKAKLYNPLYNDILKLL